MLKLRTLIALLILFLSFSSGSFAQEEKEAKGKDEPKAIYSFVKDFEIKTTPVKNQARTGTCWCFATVSFLETELLRQGKGEYDLSEMFIVRNSYPLKAESYIRYQGMANYGEGGQAHDVINQIRSFGIVPEEAYTGRNNGEEKHNHAEMKAVTESMLKTMAENKSGKLSRRWKEAYEAVLDVYMGKLPKEFTYKGRTYTPLTFAKDELKLNLDDYVELTSYSHHPFYSKFALEIPDNWSRGEYYNLPMDELEMVVDNALKNGYSVAWDGDISEHEFSQKKGYAILPLKDWNDKTSSEKDEVVTSPEVEKTVTQQDRQEAFDNYTTTDDHLMHFVGLAHDQKGSKYYLTKNSWGTEQTNGGYIYISEPYVRLKTVAIMVHKDAIPGEIAKKLGL
ncbi:MAG: aminopeptidase [Ignavibacteria bacterium]|jgi:bleomycin hydrolase|nr:aminopeptidase [Ignavibacteria bacterium]MCU7503472.1 aminopeptidase [Ignavibacteria bacterium]MCU7516196.1 aminopeptidase [Ignavibacteria bacterium]